jgi:hypothetical protein
VLLPLLLLLQSHPSVPAWKVLERAQVAWRAGAPRYELILEERDGAADADPEHRIRIRMPGRREFVVVDSRGPGPYVPVREALRGADRDLLARAPRDSSHVLQLRGSDGAVVVAVFGYAYASDPYELTLIGFDSSGHPRLLFRQELALKNLVDLDGDGRPELVGRPSIPQNMGKCAATYDPYAVYHLAAGKARYDVRLSKRYNEAHYVWAGPEASEAIEVRGCPPGARRVVRRQE